MSSLKLLASQSIHCRGIYRYIHTIKLVRHGQSEANTGKVLAHKSGDYNVALSDLGKQQAIQAGEKIGAHFLKGSIIYCSPYRRTRQTLSGIIQGCGIGADKRSSLRVIEDPRIREVEHGYIDAHLQAEMRKTHGWFWYRFDGGESPADCYDRTSSFLESMMREKERENAETILVVSHGLAIRCLVMRFLNLTVEEFDTMSNPDNAHVISLYRLEELERRGGLQPHESKIVFKSRTGRWGVSGLRLRKEGEPMI
eukprot:TRINITY_DN5379_c0_g1_i1.p1 TRINITY_DN5379_c0_g1~~TRINITY_DN5379_c0_g1_i1.p1  ORF type:complete len:254 (+),score=40.04 TRINITY_DN5379_c0_g1_i1:2-763(+)